MKQTILIIILILGFFVRFYNLGGVPAGVSNDEASYVYNAYSIFKTGKDITGKFLPLSTQLDNSFSPVPIYAISPIVGILGISPFTARLLFAFTGFLSVYLMFLIAKKIFKNEYIALSICFVLSVSPWHIHVSRIAYDSTLALFFFLAGFCSFLYLKPWKRMYTSALFWFLSFYSYHGIKVFLLAFLPMLIVLYKNDLRLKMKEVLTLCILGVLTLCSFFIIQKTDSINRQEVFLWNDISSISDTVNMERKINTAPSSLRPIFNNKLFTFLRLARENYLEAFSTNFLFLYGETGGLSGLYGTSFRGVLYFIEFPLLLIGLVVLTKYPRRTAILVLTGLALSPLPTTLTQDRTFVMRILPMVVFSSLLVGLGIFHVLRSMHKSKFFLPGVFLFFIFYGFLVLSYVYQYHFRYSLYSAETWFSSSKQLVTYIKNHQQNYSTIQVVNNGDLLIQFAFYDQLDPNLVASVYKAPVPKQLGKITFINGCIDTKKEVFYPHERLSPRSLYIVKKECHPEATPAAIITDPAEPLRTIWKIYERI